MSRDSNHTSRLRRAMTLLELLAVLVLLSASMTLLIANLGGALDEATLRSTALRLQDLDHQARMIARSHGPAVITINDDEISLQNRNSEVIARVGISEHLDVTTEVLEGRYSTAPINVISFDRRGRSDDYRMRLHLDQQKKGWRVAGLTGAIKEELR